MAVKTALCTSLETAAAASAQLGIPVEIAPAVAITSSTKPAALPGAKEEETGGSGGGEGVLAGAAAGVVLWPSSCSLPAVLLSSGSESVPPRGVQRPRRCAAQSEPTRAGEATAKIEGACSHLSTKPSSDHWFLAFMGRGALKTPKDILLGGVAHKSHRAKSLETIY